MPLGGPAALGMIDLEDSLHGDVSPTVGVDALQYFGALAVLRQERAAGGGPLLTALECGLTGFAARWETGRPNIQVELTQYPAANFIPPTWHHLPASDLVANAIKGLV
jgi:hypothetical protein